MISGNEFGFTFSFPQMDSDQRIGELIIYIASKCLDDPRFGAVKLNKLLLFADKLSYRYYGEPITGSQYMRLSQGPVPKRMLPILRALEDRNRIVVVKRKVHDFEEHRVVATDEPNLEGMFKLRDISLIDELISCLLGKDSNGNE